MASFCEPTAYAAARGIEGDTTGFMEMLYGIPTTCYWWLRTPGRDFAEAEFVTAFGKSDLNDDGIRYTWEIDSAAVGIRPMILVKADAVTRADESGETVRTDTDGL